MPFHPIRDYVLIDVEPPKPYHEAEGFRHIIVPSKYEHGPKDRAVIGTIVELGPACRQALGIGERVIIEKFRGAYVTPMRDRMIVRESDLLAVYL